MKIKVNFTILVLARKNPQRYLAQATDLHAARTPKPDSAAGDRKYLEVYRKLF